MRAHRTITAGLTLLMAFLGPTGSLTGQEVSTPAGHWDGAILLPGGELGINVDLMQENGVWAGDISIPLQNTEDFALSGVSVEGSQVSFLMAGVPGEPTFKGTLSEDGNTISGTFTQGGQALEFRLARSD